MPMRRCLLAAAEFLARGVAVPGAASRFVCLVAARDALRGADFVFCLPATGRQQILFFELAHVDAGHGFAEFFASFEYGLGVVEVRGGLDDGFGAGFGIAALENAGADEDRFSAEFTDES